MSLGKDGQVTYYDTKYKFENRELLDKKKVHTGEWWVEDGGRLNLLFKQTTVTAYLDKGEPLDEPVVTELPPRENRVRYYIIDFKPNNLVYKQLVIGGKWLFDAHSERVESCSAYH